MKDFYISEIEFKNNDTLNDLINNLRACFYSQQDNFVELCVTIHKIWAYCRGNYWQANDDEYYNSYKLLAKFGFDKKAVSRYNQCFERFIDGKEDGLFKLNTIFYGFSPSKLYELLILPDETITSAINNKFIKPKMTVKQIREIVKSLKNGATPITEVTTEINEEDIPEVYDPTKKYEYSYFEDKTKNQLLNMIWELQKAYQKLKEKRK